MSGKIKDYSGQVINGRKILTVHHQDVRGVAFWSWECCVHKIQGSPTRISTIKKHGPTCCYSRVGSNNPLWTGFNDISGKYWARIQNGAKYRNYVFDLTKEYVWSLWIEQDGCCAYTDKKLTHGVDASLDRIDSNIGYIVGNVEWVHKSVNMAKQGLSKQEFVDMCFSIANKHGS